MVRFRRSHKLLLCRYHGPRALVNMNDGFGGDTLIARNLFFASLLETSDHGPYNSWDRLPFLTEVEFNNGTASIGLAYNKLVQNFFFTGSPFSIDTDDGSDMVNATGNVIHKQPLFKTDYGGHTKAYARNVEIYGGGCGQSCFSCFFILFFEFDLRTPTPG
jgi:hypothetical protein